MIDLDAAATTRVIPQVEEAMRPLLFENYGNPSSAHRLGRAARRALEDAREQVAHILGAFPDEVVFTSGATEANNLAVFGLAGDAPGLVLSSAVEHPCVLEPLKHLQSRGFELVHLPVDREGIIQPDYDALAKRSPRLACVLLVNHETGAMQPVQRVVEMLPHTLIHCDAAQAVGKIPVRFHELGASSLSLSGHKFHAPKGVGALLVQRCTLLKPMLFGGPQQQARRPGTEPVALAVGMAAALQWCELQREATMHRLRQLRPEFVKMLQANAAPIVVNSPTDESRGSPYTLNVSFPGCRADLLLMKLDLAGIACSTGSACSSGSLLPSPVLQAMGVPDDVLRSAMRFSFSALTTEADLAEAGNRITHAVAELRLAAVE